MTERASEAIEPAGSVIASQLANGLGVLLKEDHSAPIVSFWTWYRVGSRNETPGRTGVSHWVEHMQFKGTPSLEKGQIFRDIARVGGVSNAMTSADWTAYFETVPSDAIELPLRIEPDRMTHSLFDATEVESERSVILSERHGAENNPGYALYEEVVGTAFHAHPYGHMVIGYESDLRQITRENLFSHYRRYYHPANAFVVAVGDFEAGELLNRIEDAFGATPSGETISTSLAVTEPPQPGERRVLLRRPAGTPYLRMAFHAPAAASADLVPLMVAEAILSGGKPMGFGGGGGMGRSSRLYRALVASGLARSAGSDVGLTIDPYLFQVGVTALPGGDLSRIEDVVISELRRLRDEAVPPEELARAIRQLEAQFVYSSEGVTHQAYWLGHWNIVDRWQRAASLPEEIRAVSADDILRVAQRYLTLDRPTVGWLEPGDEGQGLPAATTGLATGFLPPSVWGLDGPRPANAEVSAEFRRAVLPNGIPVLGQERPESRSIALRARVRAGSIYEAPSETGLAHLTARGLLRGAGDRSFAEISTLTDDLGASLAVSSGREFVEASVRCLREDLAEIVHLLAETLIQPDFPEDEIARVREEQIGAIAEADNDTRATADRLMRRRVYPEPNPLGRRVLGEAERVATFDRGAVRAFHDRDFGPAGTTIAIVGGFADFDETVDLISQAFAPWTSSKAKGTPDLTGTNSAFITDKEQMAGKSQADLAVGLATVARGHPEYYALDLANLILGRLGLMGRLGAQVRDRHGLAYYAHSQIEPRNDGSLWVARAGVDPANVERAIEATLDEVARLRQEHVSEDELRDAQRFLIGVLPLALETHEGVAATLLAIEEFGLGLDYLQRYPEIIAGTSRQDVLAAAQAHLDPEKAAIGIAGPADS